MNNPFLPDDNTYKRDLDITSSSRLDYARYLHLQTNEPLDVCQEFVDRKLRPESGDMAIEDPDALVLTRQQNGDRKKEGISFMRFLSRATSRDLILSPSMAAYMPNHKKQSTHSMYIEEGVKDRKVVKREMMAAKADGDTETAMIKDGEQQNRKINNNSYSGATVSTATILYYKSTHSSLTSTARTATSYANAANEKFLMGNRHYYTPEITKANLLSIINNVDLDAVDRACQQFGLVYPSADDVVDCVFYSVDNYWGSLAQRESIATMAGNMTPVERAAILYTADLYHLHKLNPEFVVNFLKVLSEPAASSEHTITDEEFWATDEDVRTMAFFVCSNEIGSLKPDALQSDHPHIWGWTKATVEHIYRTMQDYQAIIQGFWLSNTMPSSIHAFPSSYRRAAVISDTDSTMFTLQYWIEQCFGYVSHSMEAKRVVFALVFLITELMLHVLAKQSANMGVVPEKLRLLAMKNEYYFAVLSMTTRSKHYYASRDAQEGVMFQEHELEVKGVGLRDSKVPKIVNDRAKDLMEYIIDLIKNEDTISMYQVLKDIGDQERDIVASVERGSYEYMTTGQIKAKGSYKNGESTPAYQQYLLWRDVFGPYLGKTKQLPYTVVKVNIRAGNRTELGEWCQKMGNPKLADRLKAWMTEKGRKDLNTLQIPSEVVETHGIPPEIINGIDIRKTIFNTMGVYYLMLESLGVFLQDKNLSRLVSDYY